MSEADAAGSQWIHTWIEQQREQLRRMSATNEPEQEALGGQMQDLAGRWLDAAQAYLRGFSQFAESGGSDAHAAAAASSNFNEELLGAWRRVWADADSAGQDASQRFSDILGRLPSLGLAREHTEAWRELAAAQRECQQLEQSLRVELVRVQSDALALLQQRIRERELSMKPIAAWRELYDLWVDCGEQAYSQIAHGEAYGKLQAQLGNAAVRLRARQQTILEHALRQFDLPTRSELNTVHRQIRELRQKLAATEAQLANSLQPR
ncbi:MAG: poly(R)-hydroxyalkanoic acid synthase subunit PhaE, partial [Steroidobacter sp.]